jgi:hypothetical protein
VEVQLLKFSHTGLFISGEKFPRFQCVSSIDIGVGKDAKEIIKYPGDL